VAAATTKLTPKDFYESKACRCEYKAKSRRGHSDYGNVGNGLRAVPGFGVNPNRALARSGESSTKDPAGATSKILGKFPKVSKDWAMCARDLWAAGF
jgi:hypothetical protein